ncbi:hypothetical protein AHAS_Ahas19G0261600 [Arachis hypogaea]
MEREELNLNKESNNNNVGGNNSRSGGGGFIDRSKVRILLCDNDSKSSEEVFTLLIRCSYQERCFCGSLHAYKLEFYGV